MLEAATSKRAPLPFNARSAASSDLVTPDAQTQQPFDAPSPARYRTLCGPLLRNIAEQLG